MTVGYDCRPGDVIIADWKMGRRNARVTTTYPNGIIVEIDDQTFSATYAELTERGAEYVAMIVPVLPPPFL